jgi:hypothetical protein
MAEIIICMGFFVCGLICGVLGIFAYFWCASEDHGKQ